MIAAGKIVKAFGLSVFPASFFGVLNKTFSSRRFLKAGFLKFFHLTNSARYPFVFFVFLIVCALYGISRLPFVFPEAPTRTEAELSLLSLSIHDRIAYADGLESLVSEEPSALKKLIGLDAFLLFGRPAFSRQDKSIIIWQYKTSVCVLDLYMDTTTAEQHDPMAAPLVHYDTRERAQSKTPSSETIERSCLRSLLNDNRPERIDRLLLSSQPARAI